jgi:hypothetical protein
MCLSVLLTAIRAASPSARSTLSHTLCAATAGEDFSKSYENFDSFFAPLAVLVDVGSVGGSWAHSLSEFLCRKVLDFSDRECGQFFENINL